ncbi:hypothetical protein FIU97_02160 [Roseivivax sp. THAF40]|uniref:helix-turn-helix domain-containing protein n=1 Tax=Roseivivax sp. THAF40 TaxID=2587858 RepID=UPI0012680852|nr:helix-turn-helix domain-containing protein [Roseivivax sp. THAF40]QFT45369.1 hypothetical protein FIU97_02160 [Roseivivax sp. THAF40]
MYRASINRFEWLKAVLQAGDISGTAKTIASALAVQFANDETGQLNPTKRTLAEYLKLHTDTVKRGLRELRDAGWLVSEGSGGRSRAANFLLRAPGKIVPFRGHKQDVTKPSKSGVGCAPHASACGAESGDKFRENGGQSIPRQKEQSKKQKVFSGLMRPAPHLSQPIYAGSHNEAAWNNWLAESDFPTLAELGCLCGATDGNCWDVPFVLPPKPDNPIQASIAKKWAFWALAQSELCASA